MTNLNRNREVVENGRTMLRGHVAEPEEYYGWLDAESLICHSHQCGRCDRCRVSDRHDRENPHDELPKVQRAIRDLSATAAEQERELQKLHKLLDEEDPYVVQLRQQLELANAAREESQRLAARAVQAYEAKVKGYVADPMTARLWLRTQDLRNAGAEQPPGAPSYG